jgi:hypothetical protein
VFSNDEPLPSKYGNGIDIPAINSGHIKICCIGKCAPPAFVENTEKFPGRAAVPSVSVADSDPD